MISGTKKTWFGIVSFIAVFVLVVPAVLLSYPKKANACLGAGTAAADAAYASANAVNTIAVPVNDRGGLLLQSIAAGPAMEIMMKECVEDGILTILAKTLIRQITNSLVSWINSGFKGGPTFITDPGQFFTNVADAAAGTFLQQTALGFLCDTKLGFNLSLILRLQFAVGGGGGLQQQCTLSNIIGNATDFTKGNFVSGGWDGWFSMTQNPSNNGFGIYLEGTAQVNTRIANMLDQETQKLAWGSGYQSITDKLGKILTPGATIAGQINHALGADQDQLVAADEINEIVGALVGQLVGQVMSATGLAGASGSNGGGGFSTNIATSSLIIDPGTLGNPLGGIDTTGSGSGGGGNTINQIGTDLAWSINGANASQSSNGNNGKSPAKNANDNIDQPSISTQVSMTNRERNPWLEVDLGKSAFVGTVIIYPATKGVSYPVIQYKVFFSSTPFPANFDPLNPPAGVWASNPVTMIATGPMTITVPVIQGQYVRIEGIDSSSRRLGLSEVIVHQAPPVITKTQDPANFHVGDTYSPSLAGVTASDPTDGNVTSDINTTIVNNATQLTVPIIDMSKTGDYTVSYDVKNSGGIPAVSVDQQVIVSP